MGWVVAERVALLKVALPAVMVPLPRVVLPSLNVTVPVAVAGVMAAVKVTFAPKVDGLSDEVSDVVVEPDSLPDLRQMRCW